MSCVTVFRLIKVSLATSHHVCPQVLLLHHLNVGGKYSEGGGEREVAAVDSIFNELTSQRSYCTVHNTVALRVSMLVDTEEPR